MSAPEPKRSASKPLLIGCGVALVLLLLCGGGLAFFGFRFFRAGVERIAEQERFAQEWEAPAADAPAATFAPATVAGYELASSDENAAFPALGIERDGAHAVYERGDETVEVSVYRMNETEKAAVFDEVVRRIDDDGRFASHRYTRLPRSLEFSVDPPALHGYLWHAGGWLVFVRSTDVPDLEPFLRAYLEAVAARPGEEAAEGAEDGTEESEPAAPAE